MELHWKNNSNRYPEVNMHNSKTRKAQKLTHLVSNKILKGSSVYAVSRIGKANTRPRKVIWIIVLLAGLVGCGLQIHKFLKIYFSYPVVVSIYEEQTSALEFPAITVCNLNRMKLKFGICRNIDILEHGCELLTIPVLGHPRGGNPMRISERRNTLSCKDLFNGHFDEKRNSKIDFLTKYMKMDAKNRQFVGQSGSELIKKCIFNSQACHSDDFKLFQSLRYGNCYTFNSKRTGKKSLKTSSIGYNSGLKLIFNVGLDEYMDISSTVGIRVSIHDPDETPNPDENGVDISPGFETSITLEQTVMRRLPAPYRDMCIDYRSRNDQHNEEDCVKACIQGRSLELCGCVDPTINSKLDMTYCNMKNLTHVCCLDSVQEHIMNKGPPCDCPLSCNTTIYDEQLSVALWPSNSSVFNNEIKNDSLKHLRKNHASLKVFYSTLVQNVCKQLPMFEGSEIFSHLGGEMGLWLGLSLFAMFEVIEDFLYLCDQFHIYFRKK